jgi:transposase-like protein
MGDIRKNHPPAFKTKVAAEAISGHSTLAQMASTFGVHPSQISTWKTEGQKAMNNYFSRTRQKKTGESDYQNVLTLLGEKMVEVDYLKKKLGIVTTRKR